MAPTLRSGSSQHAPSTPTHPSTPPPRDAPAGPGHTSHSYHGYGTRSGSGSGSGASSGPRSGSDRGTRSRPLPPQSQSQSQSSRKTSSLSPSFADSVRPRKQRRIGPDTRVAVEVEAGSAREHEANEREGEGEGEGESEGQGQDQGQGQGDVAAKRDQDKAESPAPEMRRGHHQPADRRYPGDDGNNDDDKKPNKRGGPGRRHTPPNHHNRLDNDEDDDDDEEMVDLAVLAGIKQPREPPPPSSSPIVTRGAGLLQQSQAQSPGQPHLPIQSQLQPHSQSQSQSQSQSPLASAAFPHLHPLSQALSNTHQRAQSGGPPAYQSPYPMTGGAFPAGPPARFFPPPKLAPRSGAASPGVSIAGVGATTGVAGYNKDTGKIVQVSTSTTNGHPAGVPKPTPDPVSSHPGPNSGPSFDLAEDDHERPQNNDRRHSMPDLQPRLQRTTRARNTRASAMGVISMSPPRTIREPYPGPRTNYSKDKLLEVLEIALARAEKAGNRRVAAGLHWVRDKSTADGFILSVVDGVLTRPNNSSERSMFKTLVRDAIKQVRHKVKHQRRSMATSGGGTPADTTTSTTTTTTTTTVTNNNNNNNNNNTSTSIPIRKPPSSSPLAGLPVAIMTAGPPPSQSAKPSLSSLPPSARPSLGPSISSWAPSHPAEQATTAAPSASTASQRHPPGSADADTATSMQRDRSAASTSSLSSAKSVEPEPVGASAAAAAATGTAAPPPPAVSVTFAPRRGPGPAKGAAAGKKHHPLYHPQQGKRDSSHIPVRTPLPSAAAQRRLFEEAEFSDEELAIRREALQQKLPEYRPEMSHLRSEVHPSEPPPLSPSSESSPLSETDSDYSLSGPSNASSEGRGDKVEMRPAKRGRKAKVRAEEIDNNDFCSVCRGRGQLLCCDGCVESFHFDCLDPPVDPSNPPKGKWFCPECMRKGPLGALIDLAGSLPQKSFQLPADVRDYYQGVKMGDRGEFLPVAVIPKSQQTRARGPRGGRGDERSLLTLTDNKGKFIFCIACGLSSDGHRSILQCDYCPCAWHLDCLPMPLANPPHQKPGSTKPYHTWKCPNHIEHDLAATQAYGGPSHALRRPRHPKLVDIEVLPSPDDTDTLRDLERDGTVYRVSERGLVLSFVEKVKRERAQEMAVREFYRSLAARMGEAELRAALGAAAPSMLRDAVMSPVEEIDAEVGMPRRPVRESEPVGVDENEAVMGLLAMSVSAQTQPETPAAPAPRPMTQAEKMAMLVEQLMGPEPVANGTDEDANGVSENGEKKKEKEGDGELDLLRSLQEAIGRRIEALVDDRKDAGR